MIEREEHLDRLIDHFQQVEFGKGHTIFLSGEAGVGKTSLINLFINRVKSKATIYEGACDSLFTPRPLGPLFDIGGQIGRNFMSLLKGEKDRTIIFSTLIQKLYSSKKPVVLVFEDVHWADEATSDLIKFIAKRIADSKCLFLLSYRAEEIHHNHPMTSVFNELPTDNFSKLLLTGFSKETVDHLALKKGYPSGHQLFELTAGNPFYVMEILSGNGLQIPDRVKDSILGAFRSKDEKVRTFLEFLSILPSRIEFSLAKRLEKDFPNEMETSLISGTILLCQGYFCFKHELYRLVIEQSLSSAKRRSLHKKILDIKRQGPSEFNSLAQLIHHAIYADERELVAEMSPMAAREAAALGAHMEARKLYATAIEYTNIEDPMLGELYEHHAYECYLTHKISLAIESQTKALDIWRSCNATVREGNALRFLSRLFWFEADWKKTFDLARQSIHVLEIGFPTRERAMAYSNMSHLCMLSDQSDNAFHWGYKAIELATKLEDKETLCHALTNVGNMLLKIPTSEYQGEEKLTQSLSIALENSFQEHVARAYANLSSSFVYTHRYEKAMHSFDSGLKYCEERDLDPWKYYIQNNKVRALFEMGKWDEAETLAYSLQASLQRPGIVNIDATASMAKINMRRGKFAEARALIEEVKTRANPTHEAQRIVPVLTAELELAWMGEGTAPTKEIRLAEDTLFNNKNNSWHYTELAYWKNKLGLFGPDDSAIEYVGPFKLESEGYWKAAAELWKGIGRPYEQALALFNCDEKSQKQALVILHELGASATHEMLRSKLKFMGIKNIPRGRNQNTRSNPAQLTNRQIEILAFLEQGLQNKEISSKLFISPKTVDNHIAAIFMKLGVNSRMKAVLEAQRLGALKNKAPVLENLNHG